MSVRSTILATFAAGCLCGCAHFGPKFEPRPTAKKAGPIASLKFDQLPADNKLSADLLVPAREPYRLGSADKLDIEILQIGGTRQNCLVMPDGNLYYNTLPGIQAAGLTLPELKSRLEEGLRQYYRDPQVSIILREVRSRKVWVLGRVSTPGLYPLDNPTTVLEVIARAGGLFTSLSSGTTVELADLRHSFLVRNGEFLPVDFYKLLRDGDLSQNIYLRDGDYIYLPSALATEVYVLGAVTHPTAVGFADQVTLVSAIANAKGLLPAAYSQRIVIIRGSLAQPAVATVNLDAILAGKDPDVALEPRDIVWIPNGPWERLERYTKLVISTFVRTIAANEGGHAAIQAAQPVQTSISINPISTAPSH